MNATGNAHVGKGERHWSDTPLIADCNGVHFGVRGLLKHMLSDGIMDFQHGGVASDGDEAQFWKGDSVGNNIRLDGEGRVR